MFVLGSYWRRWRDIEPPRSARGKPPRGVLQSAFPVAENMDMSAYSVDLETLNAYIRTINEWSYSLACEEGCRYLDTDTVLKDENGNLKIEYQTGDGHHLTAEAYRDILYYIRTHGE